MIGGRQRISLDVAQESGNGYVVRKVIACGRPSTRAVAGSVSIGVPLETRAEAAMFCPCL
jgi:hypothetical protein